MTNQINNQESLPWYKQKWPWLIISLPLLSIVAGVITYQIAANKPASLVNDDYFKEGLAINKSLAKIHYAQQLGLTAEIKFDVDNQLISVKLNQESQSIAATDKSTYLVLTFSHPTQAKYDKIIQLSPLTANEFIGEIPILKQANWHIQLTDSKNLWKLKSRWLYPESKSLLISASNH